MTKNHRNLLRMLCLGLFFCALGALAQEAGVDLPAENVSAGPSLWDILYGDSIVNLLIWIGLFGTSFITLWLAIDGFLIVKKDKILPDAVVTGVRDALSQGDLGTAIATCEANPGALSNILHAAFDNINDGYEVVQQAVSSSTDMESEKLMQRVNYLNICGQIAPMLGLMGTVTGMVAAFAGLASATGAAKAKLLAQSISTALWTTCVGLIIAVPALLFFTYFKNLATRILLETEATVLDLIKVLRNAEVEDE
jgi:biopolymer transport protein ExbB